MFTEALKAIHKEFAKNKIPWAVIGSTNMKLQGIDVQPNDLDIIVKLEDIERVKEVFKSCCDVKIKRVKIPKSNVLTKIRLRLSQTDIEIIGEKDSTVYPRRFLSNQLIKVQLNDIEIPCFTLEAEAKAYRARGRDEKAKMIEDFLMSKAP